MTAQTGSLSGSVTDANTNDALPGVNVIVKNTTNGTNTDFNGNFSLNDVKSGDVLVFSYIGYQTFEYTVSSSFNVSISLEEDVEALEEVVLLGYVSQKASNISGAVTTVDGESVAKLKPVRVEDALHSTRAAVEEGVVPGGGSALIRCLEAVEKVTGDNDDQNVGVNIARKAFEAPLRQIVSNAGEESSVILANVKDGKGSYGFNASTGEYGDMIEMGILDPAKVTRTAIQAAGSVAGMMIKI